MSRKAVRQVFTFSYNTSRKAVRQVFTFSGEASRKQYVSFSSLAMT